MRRSRPIPVLATLAILALLVGACGSGSATDGAAADVPDGPGASDVPAAAASEAAAPEPAGGGDLPAIPDATYASGTARVEFSGDGQSGTIDAPLAAGSGITLDGFTSLMYLDPADQGASIQIVIDPQAGGTLSLTSGTLVAAGGRAEGCTFQLSKADASGVAGTFDCQGIPGFADGGAQAVALDASGTFEAGT